MKIRPLIALLAVILLAPTTAWAAAATPSPGLAGAVSKALNATRFEERGINAAVGAAVGNEALCFQQKWDSSTLLACDHTDNMAKFGIPFFGPVTIVGFGCESGPNLETAWDASDRAEINVIEICDTTRAIIGSPIVLEQGVGIWDTPNSTGPGWSVRNDTGVCDGGHLGIQLNNVTDNGALDALIVACVVEFTTP